jgi:hypothetical protein
VDRDPPPSGNEQSVVTVVLNSEQKVDRLRQLPGRDRFGVPNIYLCFKSLFLGFLQNSKVLIPFRVNSSLWCPNLTELPCSIYFTLLAVTEGMVGIRGIRVTVSQPFRCPFRNGVRRLVQRETPEPLWSRFSARDERNLSPTRWGVGKLAYLVFVGHGRLRARRAEA